MAVFVPPFLAVQLCYVAWDSEHKVSTLPSEETKQEKFRIIISV